MKKTVICLFSEKHYNFMTVFEGMENRWILFVKNVKILASSLIDTGLLIKLRSIKPNRVWMKKTLVKSLETAKPSHIKQGRNW